MESVMTTLTSAVAGMMFVYAMFQQFFPGDLRKQFDKYTQKLINMIYPYIRISFHEFGRDHFMRNETYSSIETYLAFSDTANQAKRLTAAEPGRDQSRDNSKVVLTIADHEEVVDSYCNVKVWWSSTTSVPKTQSFNFSFYAPPDDKRYYSLTFHQRDRQFVTNNYLPHVIKQGNAIKLKNRQRKLYTNYGSRWSHVVFEHPATFDSIAIEAHKKREIVEDLITFSKSEDFYARIGKAWKRGYLLYGPPGTGKSTMIAAMANLLGYDVYDLELTSVKGNTELRKLLIQTSSKSMIVIEDIDCSLDLTGQRKKNKQKEGEEAIKEKITGEDDENKSSQVTLSGLLNFIDGLWSACKGERLIVFTTNFKEKLDPALVRRGRMDKHIELSYCTFEAFKVLANNYWRLDSHQLFHTIECMLGETDMTPADVAECLMPKTESKSVKDCLECLIQELEKAKEIARLKAEENAKAEEEKESSRVEKKENEASGAEERGDLA